MPTRAGVGGDRAAVTEHRRHRAGGTIGGPAWPDWLLSRAGMLSRLQVFAGAGAPGG